MTYGDVRGGRRVLDALDKRLLDELRRDARLSYRELARRTGTSAPTAGAHVRRMEQLGVIRGYTVRLGDALPEVPDHAHVVCHWCKRPTAEPVEATVGGVLHPFCCTTCRDAYIARHAKLAEGA